MPEIVYVFANEAMPDYIKIGKTSRDDIKQRLAELSYPTGVPLPFECLYAAEVEDAKKVEDALHAAFDCDRPNKKREFFRTDPDRIITILKAFAKCDVSVMAQKELNSITAPEDKQAIGLAAKVNAARGGKYSFKDAGIPLGAELIFAQDETKKCAVVADSKVEYGGEHYSLTALARKLRVASGYGNYNVPGPRCFLYEGEHLSDRQDRMAMERGMEG